MNFLRSRNILRFSRRTLLRGVGNSLGSVVVLFALWKICIYQFAECGHSRLSKIVHNKQHDRTMCLLKKVFIFTGTCADLRFYMVFGNMNTFQANAFDSSLSYILKVISGK